MHSAISVDETDIQNLLGSKLNLNSSPIKRNQTISEEHEKSDGKSILGDFDIHPLSHDPTAAWERIKKTRTVMRLKVRPPKDPTLPQDKIRVVCISDTHSLTSHIKRALPNGDILIHAGDFSRCGQASEVKEFNDWMGKQPHQHKIVIAGNHELTFDKIFSDKQEQRMNNGRSGRSSVSPSSKLGLSESSPEPESISIGSLLLSPRSSHCVPPAGFGCLSPSQSFGNPFGHSSNPLNPRNSGPPARPPMGYVPSFGGGEDVNETVTSTEDTDKTLKTPQDFKRLLSNCIYLEDSSVCLFGLQIYGTPWQPEYGGWAFNMPRGRDLLSKWDAIPDGTDILITHTPPLGYGDHCCTGVRAGCVELLNAVQKRLRPKYHIYGHIHEGYGVRSDGRTVFVNASTCDINYMPTNKPIVFDIPFPDGHSRESG